MSVGYILRRCQQKMGLDPSDSGARAIMLDYLNEAANELYQQCDAEGSLMECILQIYGNQQMALPNFIYRPRGMREMTTLMPWILVNQTPRFQQGNWIKQWREWTIKNYSPVRMSLDNEGPFVLTVPFVENPPMEVTIIGNTADSQRTVEVVVMDSVLKTTTNSWGPILQTIYKSKPSVYDLTIYDLNGPIPLDGSDPTIMAEIANNLLASPYLIVDISKYPFSNQAAGANIQAMEVLYKQRLPYLYLDTDEFPVPNMDNVLVNKMLQLWAEEQGNGDLAQAYDAKATRTLARNQQEAELGEAMTCGFANNPHDSLLIHNPVVPARFGGYRRYWGVGGYGY